MSWRLSCPRCGSRAINRLSFARVSGPLELPAKSEWHCEACGESCHHLAESRSRWPIVDSATGIAVLLAVTFVMVYFFY